MSNQHFRISLVNADRSDLLDLLSCLAHYVSEVNFNTHNDECTSGESQDIRYCDCGVWAAEQIRDQLSE